MVEYIFYKAYYLAINCIVSGIKHIDIIMEMSPPPIPKQFSSSQNQTPCWSNSNSPCPCPQPPSPHPGNSYSVFCVYEFDLGFLTCLSSVVFSLRPKPSVDSPTVSPTLSLDIGSCLLHPWCLTSLSLSALSPPSHFMIWHKILASTSMLVFPLVSPFHLTSKLRKPGPHSAARQGWPSHDSTCCLCSESPPVKSTSFAAQTLSLPLDHR